MAGIRILAARRHEGAQRGLGDEVPAALQRQRRRAGPAGRRRCAACGCAAAEISAGSRCPRGEILAPARDALRDGWSRDRGSAATSSAKLACGGVSEIHPCRVWIRCVENAGMSIPSACPTGCPGGCPLVLLVPALLYALAFLFMPFSVLGVKDTAGGDRGAAGRDPGRNPPPGAAAAGRPAGGGLRGGLRPDLNDDAAAGGAPAGAPATAKPHAVAGAWALYGASADTSGRTRPVWR